MRRPLLAGARTELYITAKYAPFTVTIEFDPALNKEGINFCVDLMRSMTIDELFAISELKFNSNKIFIKNVCNRTNFEQCMKCYTEIKSKN